MSEPTQTTTPDAPEAQVEAPAAPDAEPKTFDADYVAKLRQEAAKYRTEAKANAEAARRLTEIEEAQKTEAEKLAERLADAEAKAREAELRALRSDVAQAKGIPGDILAGPKDSTPEALHAYADLLIGWRGESATPRAPPRERRCCRGSRRRS